MYKRCTRLQKNNQIPACGPGRPGPVRRRPADRALVVGCGTAIMCGTTAPMGRDYVRNICTHEPVAVKTVINSLILIYIN